VKTHTLRTAIAVIGLAAALVACFSSILQAGSPTAENLTRGWTQTPLKFEIQRPYDLEVKDRYHFDEPSNTHDFWVNFTDKPHAPPPNHTTARTEMRLENYHSGEHMFDADVNISPGCFACIMQVFDAAHGPVTMLIAHPDGTVTVGNHDVIKTNAIGNWWNLKVTNDTAPGGKIRIYVDNVLAGTYSSRGSRDYYFKCGVYSRKNSARSEARFRNIDVWERLAAASSEKPKG
jgi:hypothetical protein